MDNLQTAPIVAESIVNTHGKYLDVACGGVELFGGMAWAATVGWVTGDAVAMGAGGLIALLGFGRAYRGIKKFDFSQPSNKPAKPKRNDYDELALRDEVQLIESKPKPVEQPKPVAAEPASRAASVLARMAVRQEKTEGSA